MKNKGFTLIELLAVIVILAIIALIATPIILGIINDSKKQSEDRSAELYLDAAKKAIASYQANNPDVDFSSVTSCDISLNEIVCTDDDNNDYHIPVEMSGQAPTSGTIKLSNGNVTNGTSIVYGEDKTYNYINGKLVLAEPQASTDVSCFTYTTEELIDYDLDAEICKPVVISIFTEMGAPASYLESSDGIALINTVCSGKEGVDYFASEGGMDISAILDEAGAITDKQTEPLPGAVLVRYNCDDTEVVIPNKLGGKNVVEIGAGSFSGKGITSVKIPSTVTSIGSGSFQDNQLTSVTVPNSVVTIGNSAFKENNLESINLGNSVTTIDDYAFQDNQLTSLIIPNSVTTIGEHAFQHNQLEELTLGNSVTTTGEYAFDDNKLTEILIPSNVRTIGYATFYNNRLTSVTISNGVTTIGDYAFYQNQITNVTIPNSVTTIGRDAFYRNKITELTLGNSVETIGESAFNENQLTSVTIPNSVTTIGPEAFGCSASSTLIDDEVISYGQNNITNPNYPGRDRIEVDNSQPFCGYSVDWKN